MENQVELDLEGFTNLLQLDPDKFQETKPEQEEQETVEETITEDIVVEEPIKPEKEEVTQTSEYITDLKSKIEKGEIDDVILEIDGEKVKLSELEDVDEDTYNTILEEDTKAKDEEFKASYVEVKGLNDIQKSLINIIKSGDLEKAKELFSKPEQLQEPFQNYDSTNDNHNEYVLTMFYQNEGKSPKEIQALIKIAKEDLNLDTKAEQIVNHQKKLYKDSILNQEKQVQQEKLQEQENIKVYSKDLSSAFKERGITSEAVIKKFVTTATKANNNGEFEVDTVYEAWMKDPKKASKLIHFLLDEEDFLKSATLDTKRGTQEKMLRQVNILRDTKSKTTTKKEEPKKDVPDFLKGMSFEDKQ